MKDNQLDKALRFLNEALRLNPNDCTVLCHIAKVLFCQRNYEHAKELLQKCCRDDPLKDEGWSLLGKIYSEEGKIPEAYECYKTALHLNANNVQNYVNLGELYESNDQYEDSLNLYRSILKRFPEDLALRRKYQFIVSKLEREEANGRKLSAGEFTELKHANTMICLLYTSPSPRDRQKSRMPSSA
eukprot:TRINITY_DN9943_c0_g1_i10.p2 TRINITY_DN9943_c0_g1~~TRINITY_DN9943_c0_g1_i10.p2  ORF type:complete len:186 (-),score=29.54 TRINITY_DN9943_c0_g1_i10:32-589(-)